MDLSKYKKLFVQESEKYLRELDDSLLRVEKDLANGDLWREIHGKVHSIKGMARALSIETVTELAHGMEDWCKQFQEGSVAASAQSVQVLFNGQEMLERIVPDIGHIETEDRQACYESLLSKLRKGPENVTAEPAPEMPAIEQAAAGIDYVRVRYELIEELLGMSQEIMFHERSLPPLSDEQISGGLRNWIDDYTAMLKGFHFRLARLRLMSVSDFAHLFVKTIRNSAKQTGKEVEFKIVGGDIQADISILERIREPLIHIFRNAITHGIETQEERTAAGKPPTGTITLAVSRDKNRLLFKISDDGKGIDRPAIEEHLKARKSMTESQITQMPRDLFYETILSPDFSSSKQVTDMAGRGIGMDVVSKAVEYLGGKLTIRSEPAKGTELILKLPLSLSVIHSVTFTVGPYTISVPTANVMAIDRYAHDESEVHMPELHRLFGVVAPADRAYHIIKLKRFGDKYLQGEDCIEIVAERILGNRPLMVMPVGEVLAKVNLFSGVGIMENGEISFLLDPDVLGRKIQTSGPSRAAAGLN